MDIFCRSKHFCQFFLCLRWWFSRYFNSFSPPFTIIYFLFDSLKLLTNFENAQWNPPRNSLQKKYSSRDTIPFKTTCTQARLCPPCPVVRRGAASTTSTSPTWSCTWWSPALLPWSLSPSYRYLHPPLPFSHDEEGSLLSAMMGRDPYFQPWWGGILTFSHDCEGFLLSAKRSFQPWWGGILTFSHDGEGSLLSAMMGRDPYFQ